MLPPIDQRSRDRTGQAHRPRGRSGRSLEEVSRHLRSGVLSPQQILLSCFTKQLQRQRTARRRKDRWGHRKARQKAWQERLHKIKVWSAQQPVALACPLRSSSFQARRGGNFNAGWKQQALARPADSCQLTSGRKELIRIPGITGTRSSARWRRCFRKSEHRGRMRLTSRCTRQVRHWPRSRYIKMRQLSDSSWAQIGRKDRGSCSGVRQQAQPRKRLARQQAQPRKRLAPSQKKLLASRRDRWQDLFRNVFRRRWPAQFQVCQFRHWQAPPVNAKGRHRQEQLVTSRLRHKQDQLVTSRLRHKQDRLVTSRFHLQLAPHVTAKISH